MDVDLWLKRQLEVHHQIQPFDVEAARGDVRRHQHANAVIAKLRHHEVALSLFQVAVQAGAADPRRAERLLDAGHRRLEIAEDDGRLGADSGGLVRRIASSVSSRPLSSTTVGQLARAAPGDRPLRRRSGARDRADAPWSSRRSIADRWPKRRRSAAASARRLRIFSISAPKPISSMRSASSTTRVATPSNPASRARCGRGPGPAFRRPRARPAPAPPAAASSAARPRGSRRRGPLHAAPACGARAPPARTARAWDRGSGPAGGVRSSFSFCKIARPKAAVFPLPVLDCPIRSRPASNRGMALRLDRALAWRSPARPPPDTRWRTARARRTPHQPRKQAPIGASSWTPDYQPRQESPRN